MNAVDLHDFAAEILETLRVTIDAGQLVVHFHDGVVQRLEIRTVHPVEEGNQGAADGILRLMGEQLCTGQLLVQYTDGQASMASVNAVYRPNPERRVTKY